MKKLSINIFAFVLLLLAIDGAVSAVLSDMAGEFTMSCPVQDEGEVLPVGNNISFFKEHNSDMLTPVEHNVLFPNFRRLQNPVIVFKEIPEESIKRHDNNFIGSEEINLPASNLTARSHTLYYVYALRRIII